MAVQTFTDSQAAKLADHPKAVVKFFADWCGSCKLMAPKFKRMSDDERFSDVAFLDVNAEENPELRAKAGVNNLPFIATFHNGELKEAFATSKPEAIEQMILNLQV